MPFPADKRIINFVRDDGFVAVAQAFANRHDALMAVNEQVIAGFDLDDAAGVQLDRIGGILQLPRLSGQTDTLYRLLLQVQIELILPSAGTPANLMRIVELISGTAPTSYSESYPRTVAIGVEDDGSVDFPLLLDRLQRARSAAVLIVLEVTGTFAAALIADYTRADDIDTPLTVDYIEADPIGAGVGVCAYPMIVG